MTAFTMLLAAMASTVAVLLAFTIMRRIMRTPPIPKFLDSDVLAFGQALLLTVLIMISMLFLSKSLNAYVDNIALCFVLTLMAHFGIWAVLRVIMPVAPISPVQQSSAGNVQSAIATAREGITNMVPPLGGSTPTAAAS